MKRVNKTTDKEKGEVEGWSWVSEDTMLAGLSFLFKVGGEVTVLEETIDRKPDKKRDDLHLDCFHVLAVVKSATTNIGVHESESELTQSCPTLCDPRTIACQAPPSTGFSRQEYWSGLPFPSPGDLPDPRVEPGSPAFAGRCFIL